MIFNIFFAVLILGALWCAWKISVADFRRRIIPDAYLFPLLLIGLLVVIFCPYPVTPAQAAIGATFGYFLSAIIGLAFDRYQHRQNKSTSTPPIGMGDIKLLGVGGWWLSTGGLAISLIFACIFGALWGRVNRQRFIPFAPFFFIGAILSLIISVFLIKYV